MSKQKQTSRKTKKIVRTPATKFSHLQKRLKKGRLRKSQKAK